MPKIDGIGVAESRGPLMGSWGHLWILWGPSWGHPGDFWGHLGAILGRNLQEEGGL